LRVPLRRSGKDTYPTPKGSERVPANPRCLLLVPRIAMLIGCSSSPRPMRP
jgi:hypothetical protein